MFTAHYVEIGPLYTLMYAHLPILFGWKYILRVFTSVTKYFLFHG